MKIDKRALGVSGLMVLGTFFIGGVFSWVFHFTPLWFNAIVGVLGLWWLMYIIAKD